MKFLISFLFALAISKACGNPLFGNVKINDPCEADTDCVGIEGVSSSCIQRDDANPTKLCTCKADYAPKPDLTDCLAEKLFKPCETQEHCSRLGEGAYCTDAKECYCNNTISVPRADDLTCIPVVKEIGLPCEQHNQCQGGTPGPYSKCVGPDPDQPDDNKVCTCDPNTITDSNRCLAIVGHGQECEIDGQCTADGLENTICTGTGTAIKRCDCRDTHVINQGKTQCLPKISTIGGDCSEPIQCKAGLGDLSDCTLGKCNCTRDGIDIPGTGQNAKCAKRAQVIGDACEHDKQCTAPFGAASVCSKQSGQTIGECQCSAEYVKPPSLTDCIRRASKITDPCLASEQCIHLGPAGTATCSGGLCGCVESRSVPKTDNSKCLAHAGNEETCEENNQCRFHLGEMGVCNVTCGCGGGSKFYQDKCYNPIPLRGNCTLDFECKAGANENAFCNQETGECNCMAETKEFEMMCYLPKILGDSCTEDNECKASIGTGTSCISGTCSCNADYKPEGNGLCSPNSGRAISAFFALNFILVILAIFN